MFEHIIAIIEFILDSFIHIWPYLFITIPIAVAINMSGAAKYVNRALTARPVVAIFLATAVGAFSPFCSCGVIPIIAALLISGVPLAPVMSFWIASPSMDPEIFFLSVSTLGWPLSVWRLLGTLVLSLSAGFVTLLVLQKGLLGDDFIRKAYTTETRSTRQLIQSSWHYAEEKIVAAKNWLFPSPELVAACCVEASGVSASSVTSSNVTASNAVPLNMATSNVVAPAYDGITVNQNPPQACSISGGEKGACQAKTPSFQHRLLRETWSATTMVVKFMLLAFMLEAIIILFVPSQWITGLLGQQNPWSILAAALLGIPVYTSNLTALPLVGGLLNQGMHPAAALAFLIAGPTTTLPAMAAVWGLVTRRVFLLYALLALIGAITIGYFYALVLSFG